MAEMEGEIREGFLCPMCMQDLGTVSQLQQHFDEAHPNEDSDVIQQLKGLFGKAKRKILGKDRLEDGTFGAFGGEGLSDTTPPDMPSYSAIYWEPQELGQTRSCTDAFKRIRDTRIDRFVVETNKLIIRLDKLVSSDSSDPNKRKAFEKSVVQWAPDSDVNLCLTCGKAFTLTRRRHHCRLCGGIMCNKCSHFMPFTFARKLTSPNFLGERVKPTPPTFSRRHRRSFRSFRGKLTNPSFPVEGETRFRRSGSNTSLNSMMNPEGEPHIRTCIECRTLLERRDQQIEQRNTKPLIVQIYEKMRTLTDKVEEHLPTYLTMSDAIRSGESTYSLASAQELRIHLIKLYESIDILSKKIMMLGMDSAEPPSEKQIRLQKYIRVAISAFLQENMLGLQSLPSQEEVKKLQEKRQQEMQRKIELERQAALERERKRQEDLQRSENKSRILEKGLQSLSLTEQRPSATPPRRDKASSPGWQPMEVKNKGNADDDPMIQQMNIIRGYVKQARAAQKWDEVKMLEENLRDLQQEYWRQQQETAGNNQ